MCTGKTRACKSIPCSAKFFVSIIFNRSITEFWTSYGSIMDSLEELLLALLLQLVGRMVFPVSRLLTISMSFLDDVFRNRKKVHRILDEFLIFPLPLRKKCPHVQQMIPMFQYDKHTLHCVLGSVSSNSHNSMFPTSRIICFDSGLKGLND